MPAMLLLFVSILSIPAALCAQAAGCAAPSPYSREQTWIGAGAARRVVRFPAPAGFEVVFNESLDVNPYARQTMSPSSMDENRCRMLFEPLTTNFKDIGRSFSVQLRRSIEYDVTGELITSDISYPIREVVARQKNHGATGSAEKTHPSVLATEEMLRRHGVTILGIFEDTPVSLGVTTAMGPAEKTLPGKARVKRLNAIMIMPMGGGLIQLHAEAEHRSDADRQWAENAVRAWRDAILATNPVERDLSPPEPSFFDEIELFPFLGGVLGALVSAFVIFYRWAERPLDVSAMAREPSKKPLEPPSVAT